MYLVLGGVLSAGGGVYLVPGGVLSPRGCLGPGGLLGGVSTPINIKQGRKKHDGGVPTGTTSACQLH